MIKIQKYNEIGSKLLNYKEEFNKDYPELIFESLNVSLDVLKEDGKITEKDIDLIKNKNFDMIQFKKHISNNTNYRKTDNELRKEFKKVSNIIETYLEEENYLKDITIIEDIQNWDIVVKKKYAMNYEYLMDYFGLDKESLLKLINSSKVILGFTRLRLLKIFNDIKNILPKNNYIHINYSTPILNSEKEEYQIEIEYILDVDFLAENDTENISRIIYELSKTVDTIYDKNIYIYQNNKNNEELLKLKSIISQIKFDDNEEKRTEEKIKEDIKTKKKDTVEDLKDTSKKNRNEKEVLNTNMSNNEETSSKEAKNNKTNITNSDNKKINKLTMKENFEENEIEGKQVEIKDKNNNNNNNNYDDDDDDDENIKFFDNLNNDLDNFDDFVNLEFDETEIDMPNIEDIL